MLGSAVLRTFLAKSRQDPGASDCPWEHSRIAIAGGGIGGLSAALALVRQGFRNITVYESARRLEATGAGIMIAPNFGRALRELGVWEDLLADMTPLEGITLRRYADNEVLAATNWKRFEEKYGSPHCVVHRRDLQQALLRQVEAAGVAIMLNRKTVDIDFETSTLRFSNGGVVRADIIIAADGIKSTVCAKMQPNAHVLDTGEDVYRLTIPRSAMTKDPELRRLIDSNSAVRWLGPGGHIVGYPILRKEAFNVVLPHPAKAGVPEEWQHRASKQELKTDFKDYCSTVQKLLDTVPDDQVAVWKLRIHMPLQTWVRNATCLLGDACHPTLPYVAQGAAMAAEDAIVLARTLAKARDSGVPVNRALLIYQNLRKPRAERVVALASKNKDVLHLPDGPAQAARDAAFRNPSLAASSPDKLANQAANEAIYGLDVLREVDQRWPRLAPPAGGHAKAKARHLHRTGRRQTPSPWRWPHLSIGV